MHTLQNYGRLLVYQEREWAEAFTGIEVKNSYSISSETGEPLYKALEEGGKFLTRMFLRSMRPFTVNIYDMSDNLIMKLSRPFKWFFHYLDVLSPEGMRLGSVSWRFHLLKKYSVSDSAGNEIFLLKSPMMNPWTLNITSPMGDEMGMIQKKWSGAAKEIFSTADNFMVEFPPSWDANKRALLLGAVFLIDFVHFEKKD